MFKRTFWFGSGVVVGAGGTIWATVKVRQAAAQVTPGGLADQAMTRARRVGADVRDAVAEGRLVMRETEEQLRRDLAPPAPAPALATAGSGAIDVALAQRSVAALAVGGRHRERAVRNAGRRSFARR